jgi:membrane-associated phospholipid phosphatase
MEGSKRVAERSTVGVAPLVLTRHTMVLILVTAAVLWGIAFFLWGQVGLDKWLLMSHEELRSNEPVVALAQLATEYGMSMIVLVYLLYLLLALRYDNLRDAYPVYPLVLLLFGIAAIGGDLLKEILNRPRPFVQYAGQIHAFSSAATPAFPSGHATKSMALALPFLLLIPAKDKWHKGAKALLAIIVFGVCYSRVLLGAHYVSDVLAGVGMALTCLPLAMLLSNTVLRRMTRERLNSAIRVWAAVLAGLMVYLALL